jgi:hypothetical protein
LSPQLLHWRSVGWESSGPGVSHWMPQKSSLRSGDSRAQMRDPSSVQPVVPTTRKSASRRFTRLIMRRKSPTVTACRKVMDAPLGLTKSVGASSEKPPASKFSRSKLSTRTGMLTSSQRLLHLTSVGVNGFAPECSAKSEHTTARTYSSIGPSLLHDGKTINLGCFEYFKPLVACGIAGAKAPIR